MTELLAPAGDFQTFKHALYSGADAIYLAGYKYGARAYAKNFSIDELKDALKLAHELNKKIYVTVNTLIKDNELNDCYSYLDELYLIGVDAIIAADFAVINYILNNLKPMECHVSTQAGIKDLEDVMFYQNLNVDRCVLAREMSIDEIKKIKESTSMPLEVFAHGALCVSYSGGCLLSSMLTLRSGNRGRCSQNCRREYEIYKDNTLFQNKGYYLSMKDLNSSSYVYQLKKLNIDSLKIEGRMKDYSYVDVVTKEYRKALDNKDYKPEKLESVFHRPYTKGFLYNEDKGFIVDPKKKSNEGELVAEIISYSSSHLCKLKVYKEIKVNDRIRINDDYYFNIDKIFKNNVEVNNSQSNCEIYIYKNFNKGTKLYRMKDNTNSSTITDDYKKPLELTLYGSGNSNLVCIVLMDNCQYSFTSSFTLDLSINKPLNYDSLYKQFNKMHDTSYYLYKLNNYCDNNIFTKVSNLNNFRREILESLSKVNSNTRILKKPQENNTIFNYQKHEPIISCFCSTKEQFEVCKNLGIKIIYFNNYIPYVNAKYNNIDDSYILCGNVGAINHYKDKDIIADYSFNCFNSDSLYNLYKVGCKRVCLSLELSLQEEENLVNNYINKYKSSPSIEIMCYGHQNLMTLKYCPLRRFNECGDCKNHTYYLKDDYSIFPITHNNCVTHILNNQALNLIDDLDSILKLTDQIRLNFTIEDEKETKRIINSYIDKIYNKKDSKEFNKNTETRGYFKRPVM